MRERRAAVIVIGSEILKGLVHDTNSYWLAKRLTEMGFNVTRILVVPDEYGAIAWALKSALEAGDVVIVTGGLGFTEDDITLSAAARALGLKLTLSHEAIEMLKKRVGEKVHYYIKAANIPEGGKPLYNSVGISPGVHLKVNDKDLFFLPGIPAEMTRVFEEQVEPMLKGKVEGFVAKIAITTDHVKESEVDFLIAQLREKYSDAYFKTHATTPVVLSVVVVTSSQDELQAKLNSILEDLRRVLRVRDIKVELG